MQIQEYDPIEAGLTELRTKYLNMVFDVTSTKGMTDAKDARKTVKGYRTKLEEKRKELKAPALERSRAIDSEAKRIKAELVAIETPIDEQIKAQENKVKEEKERAARAEAERIAAAQAQIAGIRRLADGLGNAPSHTVQITYDKLEAIDCSREDEFDGVSRAAKEETLRILLELLDAAVKREKDAAELEELRREKAEREAKERAEARKKAMEETPVVVHGVKPADVSIKVDEMAAIPEPANDNETTEEVSPVIAKLDEVTRTPLPDTQWRQIGRPRTKVDLGRDDLRLFVDGYGDLPEFDAVCSAISDYFESVGE